MRRMPPARVNAGGANAGALRPTGGRAPPAAAAAPVLIDTDADVPDDGDDARQQHRAPPGAAGGGGRGRVHRYCITCFAPPEAFLEFVRTKWTQDQSWSETVRYIAGQAEVAPSTGRVHQQVYLELFDAMDINSVKNKVFGHVPDQANGRPVSMFNNMHLEACKGSQQQNIAYVSKELSRAPGTFPWSFGTPARANTTEAQETISKTVSTKILQGATLAQLVDEHPAFLFQNLRKVKDFQALKRQRDTENLLEVRTCYALVGPTGTGKSWFAWTRTANSYNVSPTHTSMGGSNPWWDGYEGQTDIVINEMPNCMTHEYFLTLTDTYPVSVQRKGDTVPFRGTKLFFTSNIHPSQWWPSVTDVGTRAAILARFGTNIKVFDARDDGKTLRDIHQATTPAMHVDALPVVRKPHIAVQPTLAESMARIHARQAQLPAANEQVFVDPTLEQLPDRPVAPAGGAPLDATVLFQHFGGARDDDDDDFVPPPPRMDTHNWSDE